ncbi:MAG: hypothetical protein VCC00_13915 [Deltaproteobacteria bacterium]
MNDFWKTTGSALVALALAATPAAAADKPIGGKLLKIKTDKGASKHLVLFKAVKQANITGIGDPTGGATLLLRWTSDAVSGRSEAITLDPTKWKGLGRPAGSKGWKYLDKDAAQGGVKVLLIKPNGLLKILAKGAGWAWDLPGALDDASVDLYLGGDQFCAAFGPGNGDVKKNTAAGFVLVKDFAAPGSCEAAICGNGMVEGAEDCDDGNLDDNDACANDCTAPASPPTTLETLQAKIFTAGCATTGACHTGATPAMGLNLSDGMTHGATVDVSAALSPGLFRIDPASGDANTSFLYIKVAAGTTGGSYPGLVGGAMPPGGLLTLDCLAGLAEWIEAGAPAAGNVAAADTLLGGTCF